jgi:hypothetical protein
MSRDASTVPESVQTEREEKEDLLLGGIPKLIVVSNSTALSNDEIYGLGVWQHELTGGNVTASWRIITCSIIPNREGRPHTRKLFAVFHQQEVHFSPPSIMPLC